MEKIYLIIIIILFILAISDLIVGVANDAVNFLNSAIGSKAAPLGWILFVAALGIVIGATFSSGMMEVARKSIFYPGSFTFGNIMVIFLAVMMTDVILLDLFNTFGLPTSTTVSIVFELLGAAVGMAILRISQSETETIANMAGYINSAKALAIISGILVSVVIAFSVGALVQYLSRIIFSFNYEKPLKYFGSLWGGLAIAAITYFILIKGAKGASFMHEDTVAWIKSHTMVILGFSLLGWTIIMQLLIWIFRLNILRLVVLVGTFALAMAFAGNDLVNFIGVPLAGFESFNIFNNAGGINPNSFMMSSLAGKIKTPTVYLLIAGLIMVITLWLSRKAKSVVKTTLNLSNQDETTERFESSVLARALVRQSIGINKTLRKILPNNFINAIDKRFDATYFQKVTKKQKGINFDLIRASVNLIVASILIALGTSLKLPLSTTYVTFMVAMGTSLADGAWDRESAVYRITGVVTVIGGWFFTALSAFTVSLLIALFIAWSFPYGIAIVAIIAVFVLYRTHVFHNKKSEEEAEIKSVETEDGNGIYEVCSNNVISILLATEKAYENTVVALKNEKRKKLKQTEKTVNKLNSEAKKLKKKIPSTIMKLSEEAFESGHYYVEVIDYMREAMHSLYYIVEPAYKHVDNNHKPFTGFQANSLIALSNQIQIYIDRIIKDIGKSNFTNEELILENSKTIVDLIMKDRKKQLKLIKKEPGSTRTNLLYLDILNETKNLVLLIVNTYKSFRDFSKQTQLADFRKIV